MLVRRFQLLRQLLGNSNKFLQQTSLDLFLFFNEGTQLKFFWFVKHFSTIPATVKIYSHYFITSFIVLQLLLFCRKSLDKKSNANACLRIYQTLFTFIHIKKLGMRLDDTSMSLCPSVKSAWTVEFPIHIECCITGHRKRLT